MSSSSPTCPTLRLKTRTFISSKMAIKLTSEDDNLAGRENDCNQHVIRSAILVQRWVTAPKNLDGRAPASLRSSTDELVDERIAHCVPDTVRRKEHWDSRLFRPIRAREKSNKRLQNTNSKCQVSFLLLHNLESSLSFFVPSF